jgi:hypothetical protein
MLAADKPPEQTMDHGYAFKKCMSYADECVRLAGLTDDLIVRDQLRDLAQEWLLAARRARRSSDDTRVVSLRKTLGDNVVPLHTNQDDDSWSPASKAVPLPQGSRRKVAPMTENSRNVIEIKLDRLIDDMRFLRSQIIAFDRRLNGIEAYLKSNEPSEQQPESKSRPWFAAAASATARAVLFAVGAATGAALLYLGTWHDCGAKRLWRLTAAHQRGRAHAGVFPDQLAINKRLDRIEDWRVETNGITVPRRSPYRLSASRDVRLRLAFARLGNVHS